MLGGVQKLVLERQASQLRLPWVSTVCAPYCAPRAGQGQGLVVPPRLRAALERRACC